MQLFGGGLSFPLTTIAITARKYCFEYYKEKYFQLWLIGRKYYVKDTFPNVKNGIKHNSTEHV